MRNIEIILRFHKTFIFLFNLVLVNFLNIKKYKFILLELNLNLAIFYLYKIRLK